MKIGRYVKAAREGAKLKQNELQRLCGWGDGSSNSRIANYESDGREPTLADLAIIAKHTGTTVSELVRQAETINLGEPPPSNYAVPAELKRLFAAANAAWGAVAPAYFDNLAGTLEALAELNNKSA